MIEVTSFSGIFLAFIVIITVLWIIFFSFRPKMVRYSPGNSKNIKTELADPTKCFVASLVISLFIVLFIWIFKSCNAPQSVSTTTSLFFSALIIFAFSWILLFTFNPKIVRYIESGNYEPLENAGADPSKCFIGALIIALLIVLIMWMFKSCR